jgi:DNA-binding transcriptional MocR family regulator
MSDQPKRINPYKMFIGAMIPNWLMERKEVSPGAKLCYARLCQFSGKDGRCFPKQKTLADGLAVGARQVRNYIEELVKHGLIQSHRRGLNKSNYYTFHDHPWMHESEQSGEVDPVGEDADCLSERLEVASPIRESSKENQLNIPAAPDDSSNASKTEKKPVNPILPKARQWWIDQIKERFNPNYVWKYGRDCKTLDNIFKACGGDTDLMKKVCIAFFEDTTVYTEGHSIQTLLNQINRFTERVGKKRNASSAKLVLDDIANPNSPNYQPVRMNR